MDSFEAGGRKFPLCRTYVMGILNVTPDSFSDGGRYFSTDSALLCARRMEESGADIIDIGGQSTRPGAKRISPEEEWERIGEVVQRLVKSSVCAVSVDTFYPEVALRAVDMGADIINDVTGAPDEMLRAAASGGAGLIVMHPGIKGKNSPGEVRLFFEERKKRAAEFGISAQRLCFDPGVGFGKSREEDFCLIANVEKTKIEGSAFLMALSRKRVTGEIPGGLETGKRLWGTIAADTLAIYGGADIIRVHDVYEAVCAAKLTDKIIAAGVD